MLLFLNFDCVLCVPADETGPQGRGDTGVRRLESVLHAWPDLRIVVTSDRRYRWTLEHFRGFMASEFQQRVIATTPVYDLRVPSTRRKREDEISDWLELVGLQRSDWLALDYSDNRDANFESNSDRLLTCEGITSKARDALHARLLELVEPRETCHAPAQEVICATGLLTRRQMARYAEPPTPGLPGPRAGTPTSTAPVPRLL